MHFFLMDLFYLGLAAMFWISLIGMVCGCKQLQAQEPM
jgi:hypothetical protein